MKYFKLVVSPAVLLTIFLSPAISAGVSPAIQAGRISPGPVLDGRLDEDSWAKADPFTDFRMQFPNPGGSPSEQTELRILFDEDNLYIGILCRDSEPSKIAAFSMNRDAEDNNEDRLKILLDPFQDKRNAYVFYVNPLGARSEGLAFGEHASLSWDGIWDARCLRTAEGWSAEIQIPFRTISFKPGLSVWGLNVERYIPRKLETIRLAGWKPDCFFNNAMEAGELTGIEHIRQGLGLTVRPFGIAGFDRNMSAGSGRTGRSDAGIDVYKNITPNFTAALSYNTDFAETEVDDRQINLTRFEVFFPEKRTFFLEGSEIFNFGTATGGYRDARFVSFLPFFSRTIGISGESPVPIILGAKVFGKLGNTNLAILDVLTDAFNGLPSQNFIAGRITRNIWEQSRVGVLFTHGSASGENNTLAGADFAFNTSKFRGNKNFSLIGWYLHNWNENPAGSRDAFGFKVDYPNDLWDWSATYASYGDAFSPGMGFIQRQGVQTLSLSLSFRPRPEKGWFGRTVWQAFFDFRPTFYWSLAGRLETYRIYSTPLGLRLESGDRFQLSLIPNRDVLYEPYEVSPGVVLAPRAYEFFGSRFEFNSAGHRIWALQASYNFGGFYSGTYDELGLGLTMKLNSHVVLEWKTNIVHGRLPEGRFRQILHRVKADVFLSPRFGLMNYIQYDNITRSLGANVRFRWEFSPGNVIFIVYNKLWEQRWDPLSRFLPLADRGVIKIQLNIKP